MNSKQILVVDDDADLLFLVAYGIKSLSPEYQVTTAEDGASALEHMQKKRFDLVVSDYMMPEMTGLDLIRAGHTCLPDALFVLMTAHHDTSYVRENISEINLHGFISKPFTMPEMLKVIRQTLDNQKDRPAKKEAQESKLGKAVQKQVQTLHHQTGAHTVLLINSAGRPVYRSGHLERAKASRLAAFVSSNFLSITELAHLFGDNESTFTSSYYQGSKYNIYAYNINGRYFLAVIFGVGGKPGTVWFYTKQTANALAKLLPNTSAVIKSRDEVQIAEDFDNLLKR
ncbi:MAG: response regulator [Anaerolineae bacterium]|nr:response regulator [Anaerolineae bacterium]